MPKSPYFNSVYFNSPYFGGTEPYEDVIIILRKLLAELITDGKEAGQFLVNDFDIEESYMPYEELTKLNKDHPQGKLFLIALPSDQSNKSRGNLALQDAAVLVGFQKGRISASDAVATIDRYVNLMGQIQNVCRTFDPDNYSWSRTECIKDENNIPLSYVKLGQSSVFESYFVVFYNILIR